MILFNGLLYEPNGAGISKYTEKLIQYFLVGGYDLDILLRRDFVNRYQYDHVRFARQDIQSSSQRIIEEQWKLKSEYKKYKLVHFPDYATPVFYQGKTVATIHDMAMYTMSDKYTLMQNLTKKVLLQNTLWRADQVICVSHFAKKELLTYFPHIEQKVMVIYEGLEIRDFNISSQDVHQILRTWNLTQEKYFLYVGTIAPHKNIINLIRAFQRIIKMGYDYKLVIAGKKGWMYEEVFEEVSQLGLEKEVVFTDFVQEVELDILYRNAKLFVSVSLYEGFGFPPLEAIGRGIPVVVSNIEVFKEMVEDCGVYCNPYDIEDIAQKIIYMLNSHSLQKQLIEKGKERVKNFNWEKTAEKTYELYRRILSKR